MTDMGITGRILVFLHFISRHDYDFHHQFGPFLRALPDQNVVANQNLTGLSLPFPDHGHFPDLNNYPTVAETSADLTFLETLFIHFPWSSEFDYEDTIIDLFWCHWVGNTFRYWEPHVIRLLSLRNLPQNNPRWSDGSKKAFDIYLNILVLDEVGILQTPWFYFDFSISRQHAEGQTPPTVQNMKLQKGNSWSRLLNWRERTRVVE